jgi:hypothetical protein
MSIFENSSCTECLEINLPEEICSISDVELFVHIDQRILLVESKSGHRIRMEIPELLDIHSSLTARFSRKRHKLTVQFNRQSTSNLVSGEARNIQTDDPKDSTARSTATSSAKDLAQPQMVEHGLASEFQNTVCYSANVANDPQMPSSKTENTTATGYQQSSAS